MEKGEKKSLIGGGKLRRGDPTTFLRGILRPSYGLLDGLRRASRGASGHFKSRYWEPSTEAPEGVQLVVGRLPTRRKSLPKI